MLHYVHPFSLTTLCDMGEDYIVRAARVRLNSEAADRKCKQAGEKLQSCVKLRGAAGSGV